MEKIMEGENDTGKMSLRRHAAIEVGDDWRDVT